MIQSIRNQMHGSIQCNLVEWDRQRMAPWAKYPLLFTLDDFTVKRTVPYAADGGAIYALNPVSGNIDERAHWKIPDASLDNPYMSRWQTDDPGGGKYLMVSNKIVLEIEGKDYPSDTRVRVQVFSLKGNAFIPIPGATNQVQSMPEGLVHLDNMANFSANPNLLPHKYFKTYVDKTVIINSQPAPASGVHPTTINTKYVTFTIAPKGGKMVTQATTYPPVQDVEPVPALVEPPGGWYGPKNRKTGEVLYCLVSTDDAWDPTAPTSSATVVSCSSYRKWRDNVGAYNR